MTQSKTSLNCKFPDAFTCEQAMNFLELQLVDEHDNALVGLLVKAENQATRDAIVPIETLYAITDSQGIARFDDLHPLDIVIYVEEQKLADEMSQRSLRLDREQRSSVVKERADKNNYKYSYVKIGELCQKMPMIDDWFYKEPPFFHFPKKSLAGFLIPDNELNERHVIEVCPFRAWVLKLQYSEQYSIINAYNLGVMADLAYAPQNVVNGFFNHQCLDLSKIPQVQEYPAFYHSVVEDVPFNDRYISNVFIDTATGDSPEGDTQLFYVYNKKQVVVAWRGTEPGRIQDIITDGTFRPVPCPELVNEGKVHKGFYDAYNLSKNKSKTQFNFLNDLSQTRQLFVCGHSLGGALSLIFSTEMADNKPLLYTYGMPRTFTTKAISLLSSLTHYRHVNDADTVTSIPPQADVDNLLYEVYGTPGTILGFFGSFWSMLPQTTLGINFGDPYWHHGNIVAFFKVEQSLMKTQNKPILWIGGGSSGSPTREISYKLSSKAKLYLVPSLNAEYAKKAEDEHKEFINSLDQKSLDAYFPKNTNPLLDSAITNPADHSMANKYMPFINNQLIEMIDANRDLKRVRSRKNFIEQMEKIVAMNQGDLDETNRNRMFIQLQDMLSSTLHYEECDVFTRNALSRFNNSSEEEIESLD